MPPIAALGVFAGSLAAQAHGPANRAPVTAFAGTDANAVATTDELRSNQTAR